MDAMEEQIKQNIDYEILKEQHTDGMLDEIVSVMVEAACTTSPTFRIGDNELQSEVTEHICTKLYLMAQMPFE